MTSSLWLRAALLALAFACITSGCGGSSEGRADEELGDLVVSPATLKLEVDVDKASSDAVELLSATALPHHWTSEVLGAHWVHGSSSVEVLEGGSTIEELSDELLLAVDSEGHYRMTLDNSKEYGRHASYDGKTLYLRPRFGPYHARLPQSETEANDIRNEVFAGASDYLELLGRQLELSDKGESVFEGRAARSIALQLAPEARTVDAETLSHKLWRNSIVVDAIRGTASLDAETGAVLYLQFEGTISYQRDGRSLQMKLQAERTISKVGHEESIGAPDDAAIMTIGARRRELAEREELLKSIAPPARKAPTPKASLKDGR